MPKSIKAFNIKSAPKDGTHIILIGGLLQIGNNCAKENTSEVTAYWEKSEGSFIVCETYGIEYVLRATHWIKIPTYTT